MKKAETGCSEKTLLEQFNKLKQENELLEKKILDLSRSQKVNQVLFRITNALNTAFDLNQLYDLIHLALSKIINVPSFYIALYDKIRQTIDFPYHSDTQKDPVKLAQNLKCFESLIRDIVTSGRSLMLTKDDFSQKFQHPGKPLSFPLPEIWIGIPLKVRNEAIGVMVAQSYTDPNQYEKTDINLLHSVSNHIAIAIERKKTEDTLRESEERLTMALEATSEGIWDWHIEQNEIYIDPRMYHVFGYPADAFPNTYEHWAQKIHPEDIENLQSRIWNHVKGKIEPFISEFRAKTHSGKWIWILCRGNVVEKNSSNRSLRMMGTYSDITAQKQTLQALEESEERFRTLQEASFGGIGIHEKGMILDANQGLSTLTGYSHDELLGMNGLMLIDESTREMVLEKIVSGYEKPYDAIGIRKDGSTYPLEIQGKEIPYHGRTVRVTEFRDITERKKAEKAIRESEEKLIQLQKMEAIGTLAGGVAHDFNNLLGGILGNASLLKMYLPMDSPSYKKAVTIEKIVHRGANLARQLLGFARGGKYQVIPINMNSLIQDTLEMFGRTCKDNQIHTHFQKNIWIIEGDRTQLEQVILNLLINAADAMPDGGEIYLDTHNTIISDTAAKQDPGIPGNYISITIRDTGSGMDKKTKSKIFDPFFTTKEQGKGTGLGLSSAYGIIKNHNGHIAVTSEPNQGSIFMVFLPASDKKIDKTAKTDYQLKVSQETLFPVDDNDFRR